VPAIGGRSPLLRLQSDEKLVALIRRGHHGAFEALVHRYQPRLLAFCRHMLSSQEDAEDVLQEVFAASFNAIIADERPIKARPWLYRIARNRCLNHLRRPQPAGQDSMDIFERDAGTTTADTVHRREEFRRIVADVQDLPETQRTALLLREIDALSYEQIAEAMETTVPSVKSLLVRARVSLAEAAEARLLTCDEVRLELGQVAEGLTKSSPPVRRHLKACDRCRTFRGELRKTTRALAAVYPLGPLVFLKKLSLAKLGLGGATGGAASGGGAAAGGAAAGLAGGAAGTAATAAGGITAGGAVSAGAGAIVSKAAAGMAAAVIVTAGAVEVRHVRTRDVAPAPQVATAPVVHHPTVAADPKPKPKPKPAPPKQDAPAKPAPPEPAVVAQAPPPPPPAPVATVPTPPPPPAEATVQVEEDTTTLPPPEDRAETDSTEPGATSEPTTPPGESETAPTQPPPAPTSGEPVSGSQPLQP
jgi:RNA polymerase sigma factor (sigma-70 family)